MERWGPVIVTKIVLDVLLFDGPRGLVSNQFSKTVYSHGVGLKHKMNLKNKDIMFHFNAIYIHHSASNNCND